MLESVVDEGNGIVIKGGWNLRGVAAMLPKVGATLRFIPLESHCLL